jgi:hypothetical protein
MSVACAPAVSSPGPLSVTSTVSYGETDAVTTWYRRNGNGVVTGRGVAEIHKRFPDCFVVEHGQGEFA